MPLKMNRHPLWGAALLVLLSCRSQLKAPEPPPCASPLTTCPDSTACVDLLHDSANCGACQSRCPADATCVQGACQPRCPSGFVSCGPDGSATACADVQRDPHNCGGCGKACASWEICREGRCGLTCADGQNACDGADGRFCTDLRTDNRNCGACGKTCPAGKACRQGRCDDCRMTVGFSERDWVMPMAPRSGSFNGRTANGDFNGDGKLDVAVDLGYGQVRLLLGDGTGQLVPGELAQFKNVTHTRDLLAMDLNRDGKQDLVALTWDTPSKLLVMLGKGDGRFDQQTSFSLPSLLATMSSGDVNGDGLPDLLIAGDGSSSNTFTGVVVVLLSADGSMRISDQQSLGAVTQPPVLADVTGDGIPDLVLAQARQVLVLRGLGTGKFETDHVAFANWNWAAVAAGDLDGDGKPELIATGFPPSDAGETSPRLGIVDGATGRLRETLTELPNGRPELWVRDVDGDGKLDVLAVASTSMRKDVWVLAGKGDGQLVPGPRQEMGVTNITPGDFNGDQIPDLLLVGLPISVSLGLGHGLFARPANRMSESIGLLATADVDGDALPDLIATQRNSIAVFRGMGNGSFHDAVVSSYKFDNGREAVADFDGDGRADVCCSDRALLKGQSNGSFWGVAALPENGCPRSNLMARDLDRDGILDLINLDGTTICVMHGQTRLGFARPASYETLAKMDSRAVAVADVDGDKIQDVVAALADRSAVALFYGKADGSFENAVQYQVGPAPTAVTLADWNGDGRPDLVVADEGGLSTFQNRGQRAWGPRFSIDDALDLKRVLSVDWNGDGLDDLLAIAYAAPVKAVVSRGDGRFDATTVESSMGTYEVALADFNRDARPDFAITYNDRADIRVFLQKGVACAP